VVEAASITLEGATIKVEKALNEMIIIGAIIENKPIESFF